MGQENRTRVDPVRVGVPDLRIEESGPEKNNTALAELAGSIREGLARMAVDAFAVGHQLLRAKQLCGHGKFQLRLADFGFEPRLAQNLMNVAANLGDKCETFSHLGLSVLYKLGAPSTPLKVVNEVVGLLERGESITGKLVDEKIRTAKGATRKRSRAEREAPPADLNRDDPVEHSTNAKPSPPSTTLTTTFEALPSCGEEVAAGDAETKNTKEFVPVLARPDCSVMSAYTAPDQQCDPPKSGDSDLNIAGRLVESKDATSPVRSRQQVEFANRKAYERLIKLKPETLDPICRALRECGNPVDLAMMLETFLAVRTRASSEACVGHRRSSAMVRSRS